ncbi:MAG: hypothetical protein JWO19_4484 [Bryobacterales bacterium]|nr:hypothetical protein [Bryobacterales bacterium]
MHNMKDAMTDAMEHGIADEPRTSPRPEHREGKVARTIEQQTAKLPSDTFLWTALGSMGISLGLALTGRGKAATFVGQWAPTLLILGLYNKLVKVQGSDGA